MNTNNASIILAISVFLALSISISAAPQANGKIAFTSNRDGNFEIYVMDPDGSNQVRITNNPGVDVSPTWSADGRKIAFVSQKQDGSFGIFTMNGDGTDRTEVTSLNGRRLVEADSVLTRWRPLSWSPNGARIAFNDYSDSSGSIDIFVVNADGSGRTNLTPDHAHLDLFPTWSPDGSKILFSRYDMYEGYFGTMLHTINPDGTNLTRLLNVFVFADGWNEDAADWSAAANKIVYTVNRWDFVFDLYIANPDGTERKFFHGCDYLDNSCKLDALTPVFSPDGTKIAFSELDFIGNTPLKLYVKNLDGTGLTLLTNNGASPSWQPLAPAGCASVNPIDCPDFFIRQQYRDFLGREADSNGFADWMATLQGCGNGGYGEFDNTHCDRVHVSAGFVQSNEFQGRGYWLLRFGYVGLNRQIGSVRSSATYAEFTPALAQVGGSNSPAQEEAAKVAYTNAFVQRQDFLTLFPTTLTASQYVDGLESNAQVSLPNKQTLIDALNAGTMTRVDVLRNVVESQVVSDKYIFPAFVTMEYFGYLHRDPDTIGYQNWVNTLASNPSDYRHMIFGFIYSTEYRSRFGTP